MKLTTYEDSIAEAKATLRIADAEFEKMSSEQAQVIVKRIEDKFVEGSDWTWWWEHLRQTDLVAFHIEDAGYMWLRQMLPEQEESVWFIVEPFDEKKQFSIYQALTKHIQAVLEECFSFEYYVVASDLSWLLGENHHGCFFFVGEPVTTRMQEIVAEHPDEWDAETSTV